MKHDDVTTLFQGMHEHLKQLEFFVLRGGAGKNREVEFSAVLKGFSLLERRAFSEPKA